MGMGQRTSFIDHSNAEVANEECVCIEIGGGPELGAVVLGSVVMSFKCKHSLANNSRHSNTRDLLSTRLTYASGNEGNANSALLLTSCLRQPDHGYLGAIQIFRSA